MDFDLSDEQRQLKESVERLLADAYEDLNRRKAYTKETKGYSAELWQQYADLGILAAPFPEEAGGLGQGLTETMIVAEALGRALAVEPYMATVVLAGGALMGNPPSPHTFKTPFFPLDLYQRDVANGKKVADILAGAMPVNEAAAEAPR